MSTTPDIAIVGGGIIGLTTAYFLARAGHRVIVIDKGDFGQEASWAGAGILPDSDLAGVRTPIEQLRAHGVRLFPALSQELREFTGIDNGYRRCGGLEFPDLAEAGHAEEWHGEGGDVGQLSAAELCQLEPRLAHGLGRAWHLPDMAQVRNPRHLRALQSACQALGVLLRPQCAVHSLCHGGRRISGCETPEGRIAAGSFLITAGAWTDGLLDGVGWRPGIRPVRGQMVLLSAPSATIQRILLCGPRYIVPRGDGRILVGSTEEDAGFEKRNTAIAMEELLALAVRLVPDLGQATMERCWSGLRPGSPDGLPFLGRVPGWDNLFVAAGHFRAGIQLSPGTGQVMTELLLGKPLTVPLDAFRLDRQASCRA
jgi:glycine oxidase